MSVIDEAALVLHQTRYDLRAFRRNRQSRFFTLALPVLFLVLSNSAPTRENQSGLEMPSGKAPNQ
jgi:hypothetical protein